MTKIETEHVEVHLSQAETYRFLNDFNNFNQLLPEDKVENWDSTTDECSFRIKGMTDIGMAIEKRNEPSEINITSKGKVPFDFKLTAYLEQAGEEQCRVHLIFSGDINPFMKMMVEKPLTNFFNILVNNLAKIHE